MIRYTITSANHNIRAQANANAPVLGVLKTGDKIAIIGKSGQWLEVKVSGDKPITGFIFLTTNLAFKQDEDTQEAQVPSWYALKFPILDGVPPAELQLTPQELHRLRWALMAIANSIVKQEAPIVSNNHPSVALPVVPPQTPLV